NAWYNGPSNNIRIVDARRRPDTQGYYNRVDRSTNAYNNNGDNSPRYTNDGRRQTYDRTDRSSSSSSGSSSSDGYYSRPRGGATRSYEGYSGSSTGRTRFIWPARWCYSYLRRRQQQPLQQFSLQWPLKQ
ncbi:MAG: hypothetical protein MUE30_17865, partial [Spirosomaceae bacterium]|nr:hypothetical protein [Spirosomataceae bacterium]